MIDSAPAKSVVWTLRIGVASEFIGHGMLGLGHPAAWTSYFGVMGIGRHTAFTLMPAIGGFDVAMAIAVLVIPIPAVILYMAVWGLWTASLRPLAGEPVWEAVERAGNYGAPLALLLLTDRARRGAWRRPAIFRLPEAGSRRRLEQVLQFTAVLLLAGHGALGLWVHKPLLAGQYAAIGLPVGTEPAVGAIELGLALAVLFRPSLGLLVAVAAWKLATEALSPLTGSPIWVFFEHGGSYAAPLALALLRRSGPAAAVRQFGKRLAS
jgi:uncharacterized membrane protein YphA (DoxX/SURF4 family)